jgi:uncharacterized membrane protein
MMEMIALCQGFGIFGLLMFIAVKAAVVNDVSHQILDKMENKQCKNCEKKED